MSNLWTWTWANSQSSFRNPTPKSVRNKSQRAYTWPPEQISTIWTRLNQPVPFSSDAVSVCVERSRSGCFVSSRCRFVAFAFRFVAFTFRFVAFAFRCEAFCGVCAQSHLHTTNCKEVGIHAWVSSGSSSHLQQNGNVRFVFNNPLSVVYLPFCERVRVVCVHRLFFARSSSVFRLSFKHSPSVHYVQSSFCAGVYAEWKRKRNFLIKGVAFDCTQSGGAPRFRALARTLT